MRRGSAAQLCIYLPATRSGEPERWQWKKEPMGKGSAFLAEYYLIYMGMSDKKRALCDGSEGGERGKSRQKARERGEVWIG